MYQIYGMYSINVVAFIARINVIIKMSEILPKMYKICESVCVVSMCNNTYNVGNHSCYSGFGQQL